MENQTIPNYTMQDVKVTPNEMDAIITDIKISYANAIFGENCKNPQQELLVLSIENHINGVKTEQYIPKYPAGNVPDSSKLGLFLKRYGKFQSGMEIRIEKDQNGYWKIRI